MTKDAKYVASAHEHGQSWHYYAASAEEALATAKAHTLASNWATIYVVRIQQENEHEPH